MPAIKYAMEFAKRGWYVFPLQDLGKRPRKNMLWRSLSSKDISQIEAWSIEYPVCNWGLDCGKSGLCVIDIDNKGEKKGDDTLFDLELEHGDLSEISLLTAKTPNNGTHYYFEGLTGSGTNRLGLGVDVKSVGGYVVIPGSKIKEGSGSYTGETHNRPGLLPKWTKDLIGKPREKSDNQEPATELDQDLNVRRAIDYLQNKAEPCVEGYGGDENAYKVFCKVRDLGVSESKAVDIGLEYFNERCTPPWSLEELSQKIMNAYEYGKNQPASATPQADFDEIPENFQEIPVQKMDNIKDKGVRDTLSFSSITFPPKRYFLDPWITSQSISMIYGGAGTGKTWFVMSLLKCIALGEDIGPWKFVEKVPVLYMDAEMTGVDVQERIHDLQLQNADPNAYHIYNDEFCTSLGHPKADITSKLWRNHMTTILKENRVGVWAIDNLASLSPKGDENTKDDWNPINQWLLELRYAGITSLLLHHTNKAGDQRGTSARIDNIDHSIRLVHPQGYTRSDGARFDVDFQKSRMRHKDLPKITDIQMQLIHNKGNAYFKVEKPSTLGKFAALRLISDGLKNKDIAEEIGCSKANVTKLVQKLQFEGYIDEKRELTGAGLNLMMKGG